jgi:uncharacterized membrane protein (DUF106 family)
MLKMLLGFNPVIILAVITAIGAAYTFGYFIGGYKAKQRYKVEELRSELIETKRQRDESIKTLKKIMVEKEKIEEEAKKTNKLVSDYEKVLANKGDCGISDSDVKWLRSIR